MRQWRMAVSALSIVLMVPIRAGAQSCPEASALTRGLELPLSAVRYLADDGLDGRLAGSAGERCAGDYVAGEFRRLGLQPAGEAGGWFQSLPLASAIHPQATGTGRNVVARLIGSDPELRREYVVIGAHYDHLGRGGSNSLEPGAEGIHNGADDNASGVAALLAAADRLTRGPPPARSVLFIAFTGEESGLLGSAYFVQHSTIAPDTMVAMINMDMVGRLSASPLIVYGVDTATEWRPLLEQAGRTAKHELVFRGEGYGPSDHTSFYARDVPVLHFFTNVHGDYHRPSDDWEKIDVAGIGTVAAIVSDVATAVANRRPTLTLQRGAGQPPSATGSRSAGYGAYLGSVPDFTPVARGVKLSGVTPGSPADRAGLRAGDVLIGLGTFDVADLQGMTDALSAYRPGDVVRVNVLRGGQTLTLSVTLGTRAAR